MKHFAAKFIRRLAELLSWLHCRYILMRFPQFLS